MDFVRIRGKYYNRNQICKIVEIDHQTTELHLSNGDVEVIYQVDFRDLDRMLNINTDVKRCYKSCVSEK